MTDILSPPLAVDWISRLLKRWTIIRRNRAHELQEIQNTIGDPELLAHSYVQPNCQQINPADHDEDESGRAVTQPIFGWLNQFLKGRFFERDGRNTVFILSDAGMGKSSLLMMLKLSHLGQFWPDGLDFQLLKLGADTLGRVAAIKDRKSTVLLLDSLDEDPLAWGRVEDRLLDLLKEAVTFRQVVLTCRTQFFPEGGGAPVEAPHKIIIGGYSCNLLYLSPFNDEQVELYLRKLYPNRWMHRLLQVWTKRDNPQLSRAREFIKPMQSLRMRPMLLAHVEDLMRAGIERWGEFGVYNTLVRNWVLREVRKQSKYSEQQLWEVCEQVAVSLQAEGSRTLSLENLDRIRDDLPAAKSLEAFEIGGRSLLNKTSDGGFRFSHYSIQEFLIARCFVSANLRTRARVTDLLIRFIKSWLDNEYAPRVQHLNWELLFEPGFSGINFDGEVIARGRIFRDCTFYQCDISAKNCVFFGCRFNEGCRLIFQDSLFSMCVFVDVAEEIKNLVGWVRNEFLSSPEPQWTDAQELESRQDHTARDDGSAPKLFSDD